jgi:urease accessory protein UreH
MPFRAANYSQVIAVSIAQTASLPVLDCLQCGRPT